MAQSVKFPLHQMMKSGWTVGLLLLSIGLAACSSTAVEPENVEPESASPTETAVLQPQPTDTPIPITPSPTAPPPTATQPPALEMSAANLSEPFVLGGGQEIAIAGDELHLRFESVLEDSRCPTQVTCVWAGQARILIIAEQTGQSPVELELNSNTDSDPTANEGVAYGYVVQLQQLDPYPKDPNDPIPFEAYQATLVVTRP